LTELLRKSQQLIAKLKSSEKTIQTKLNPVKVIMMSEYEVIPDDDGNDSDTTGTTQTH
jgi:hypothetical protein